MTDFAKTRQMFDIPPGVIYLNGNSLGPMPKAAPNAINSFLMDEWRTELVRGWNTKNWFMQSNTLGDRLGRLIGAPAGSTVVGDTLSIRVFQAVAAALAAQTHLQAPVTSLIQSEPNMQALDQCGYLVLHHAAKVLQWAAGGRQGWLPGHTGLAGPQAPAQ